MDARYNNIQQQTMLLIIGRSGSEASLADMSGLKLALDLVHSL